VKNAKLFFVWEVNAVRNNFGSLLIFLAEIEAMTYQHNTVNICYISGDSKNYCFICRFSECCNA
jgi:hypothetical protein